MVVRDTFTVVDNPHFNITGGRKVEIVWAVFAPVDEFWQALPEETRTQFAKKDYFPNVGAGDPMSHMELSGLAHYASWFTHKAIVQEVEAMLDPQCEDSWDSADCAFLRDDCDPSSSNHDVMWANCYRT